MAGELRQPVEYWIEHLDLVEHPGDEDGYFNVAFEDTFMVKGIMDEERAAASIAYFLQKRAEYVNPKTMFFKCQSTEMIFYHYGDPLTIYLLPEDGGELEKVVVGLDAAHGEVVSFAVPKDRWFTRLVESCDEEAYTLFSCSLAPGFDGRDFEAATLETVRRDYIQ
eukprot:GFUD01024192.1.p1 GENE.GFUD01024192.1~~GFUD01024192.1.p1  ORF type:complete len:177 (+),score=52.24 GFUD01024192.1:36-533(+)